MVDLKRWLPIAPSIIESGVLFLATAVLCAPGVAWDVMVVMVERMQEQARIVRDTLIWIQAIRQDVGWYRMLQNLMYWLSAHVYLREDYWLFEADTVETVRHSGNGSTPRVPVTVIMVRSNRQADMLERCGIRFRQWNPRARRGLEAGATACLLVVDGEVANVAWCLMNDYQSRVMDEAPYATDFRGHEAQLTHSYTPRKWRRQHLRVWSVFVRCHWLYLNDFKLRRSAIRKDNIVSLIGVAQYPGVRIAGDAVYTRILGRKRWQERRFVGTGTAST